MKNRSFIALLGSVGLLVAGAAVVLFPSLAGAHANSVTGESACVDASGTYTVTWTIVNDYPLSETATLTSTAGGGSLSQASISIVANGTGQVTQTNIPGNATTASLHVDGLWSDSATHSISGSVALSGQCITKVTPVAPTILQATCTNTPGDATTPTYTVPATAGVNYQVAGSTVAAGQYPLAQGSSVAITAVAQAGYALQGTTTWTLTANVINCVVTATPATPTILQAACTGTPGDATNPSYTVPTTTGVNYFANGSSVAAGQHPLAQGSSVTITAVAQAGYALAEGAQSSWTLTANVIDCTVHVTVVTTVFGNETCVNRASVAGTLILANTTGVTYTVTPSTAIIGFVPASGDSVVTPADVVSATIPAGTYSVTPGVTVIVTAVAAPGYTLEGTTVFPHTYPAALDCTEHVTPLTPTFMVQQCLTPSYTVQPATVTIPSTTGITYSLDGTVIPAGTVVVGVGTHTVTAAAVTGYTLAAYPVGGWTTTTTAVPCALSVLSALPTPPVLASTGTDSADLAILGVLVLVAGAGLVALTSRRRNDTEA